MADGACFSMTQHRRSCQNCRAGMPPVSLAGRTPRCRSIEHSPPAKKGPLARAFLHQARNGSVVVAMPAIVPVGTAMREPDRLQLDAGGPGNGRDFKRGEGVAGPLTRTRMFPPLASHLLTVGEETGKLDLMFARMADIYEEETRAAIKRFTSIFEPLVILIMGIIVGAMVLSMLIAITSINDVAI